MTPDPLGPYRKVPLPINMIPTCPFYEAAWCPVHGHRNCLDYNEEGLPRPHGVKWDCGSGGT